MAWVKEHSFIKPFLTYKGEPIPWKNSMEVIREFREQVEAKLPGMYTFFDEGSLHVTIRPLN